MDAPPKQLSQDIKKIARTTDGRTIVRHENILPETVPLSVDSLPVLNAFNDFLAEERQQARKRMLALSACFLLLLITVSGALIYVGFGLFRQTQADIAEMQTDIAAYRKKLAEVSPATIQQIIENSGRKTAQEIINTVEQERRQELENAQNIFKQEQSGLEQELSGLKTLLADIEMEKSEQRRQLALMKSEWEAIISEIRSTGKQPQPQRTIATERRITPADNTSHGNIAVPLEIGGERFSFLLPIPE